MGRYTDNLNGRLRQKRKQLEALVSDMSDDPWTAKKVQANLRQGYHADKGLRDGRCNRYACQAPIGANPELGVRPAPQWSMRDHEQHTERRLYYCHSCAVMFNQSDYRAGTEQRCRRES